MWWKRGANKGKEENADFQAHGNEIGCFTGTVRIDVLLLGESSIGILSRLIYRSPACNY